MGQDASTAILEAPPTELAPPREAIPLLPSPSEVAVIKDVAKLLATSGAPLPRDCRTEAAIATRMLYARELGLPYMVAINQLYNVDGKLTLPATLMAASVVRRRLGSIDIKRLDDDGCTVRVTRPNWDPNRYVDVSFTRADAARADLLEDPKRPSYRRYPRDMFRSRALSFVVRTYFPEVFFGITTPDEAGVETNQNGEVVLDLASMAAPAPGIILKAAPVETPAAVDETNTPVRETTPAPRETPPAAVETPPVSPAPAAASAPPPPPAEPPASAPDQPQSPTDDEIRRAVHAAKLTPADWPLILRHFNGATKLAEVQDRRGLLAHVQRIEHTRRLARRLGVSKEAWAKAIAKRGVQTDLELPPTQWIALYDKLAEKTPFEPAAAPAATAPTMETPGGN